MTNRQRTFLAICCAQIITLLVCLFVLWLMPGHPVVQHARPYAMLVTAMSFASTLTMFNMARTESSTLLLD